ncbi:MAG: metallophosphoesterase [Lachnospiraceae bacterium]|nr:metallophosphoesterase [Lachnospiraceae bacterium]
MVAVCLIVPYVLVQYHFLRWFLSWLGACHPVFKQKKVFIPITVVYTYVVMSLGIAVLMPDGMAERATRVIGNYALGFSLYIAMSVAIADVVHLIRKWWLKKYNKKPSKRFFILSGLITLLVITVVGTYGLINARVIRRTAYEITVPKVVAGIASLKVILIADLHMGYSVGVDMIADMVDKINQEDADLIILAGDIYDNSYDALEDPARLAELLASMKSKYGTYACYGNHDVDETVFVGFTFRAMDKPVADPRMEDFLKASKINLLRDEYVLIDDKFYVYGRPDASKPGEGIDVRKTPAETMEGIDLSKPVIMIDHQPKQLEELAAVGVDVDLCGHTHDGQMFPGNILTWLMWDNSYGYEKFGNMHNIVTSGVGVYGPFMRVGTKAEYCPITIRFAQ